MLKKLTWPLALVLLSVSALPAQKKNEKPQALKLPPGYSAPAPSGPYSAPAPSGTYSGPYTAPATSYATPIQAAKTAIYATPQSQPVPHLKKQPKAKPQKPQKLVVRTYEAKTGLSKLPFIGMFFKNKAGVIREERIGVDFDVEFSPSPGNVVLGFTHAAQASNCQTANCPVPNCQAKNNQVKNAQPMHKLATTDEWRAIAPPAPRMSTRLGPVIPGWHPGIVGIALPAPVAPACATVCADSTTVTASAKGCQSGNCKCQGDVKLSPIMEELVSAALKNAKLEAELAAEKRIAEMKEQVFGELIERVAENAQLKARIELAEEKVQLVETIAETMIEGAKAKALAEAVGPLFEVAQQHAIQKLEAAGHNASHNNHHHAPKAHNADVQRLQEVNAALRKKIAEMEQAILHLRAATTPRVVR